MKTAVQIENMTNNLIKINLNRMGLAVPEVLFVTGREGAGAIRPIGRPGRMRSGAGNGPWS